MKRRSTSLVCACLLEAATCGVASADDLRVVGAARSRQVETVRQLVAAHANVNAAELDGATALHWAAHWDDHEIADLLLRAGANVNASTDLGETPLSLACRNGSAR